MRGLPPRRLDRPKPRPLSPARVELGSFASARFSIVVVFSCVRERSAADRYSTEAGVTRNPSPEHALQLQAGLENRCSGAGTKHSSQQAAGLEQAPPLGQAVVSCARLFEFI